MKKMTINALIVAVAAITLIGCKEESGGSSSISLAIGNVALLSPTYEIKSTDGPNMAMVLSLAMESFDLGMGDSGLRSLSDHSSAQRLREITSRASSTETEACTDGGSATFTVTSNDISGEEPKQNGSMEMNITFNNCSTAMADYDSDHGWYDLSINGSTSIDMTWRGYDNNQGFEDVTFAMTFDNFTTIKTYDTDPSETSMVDGVVKAIAKSNNVEMAWALSLSSPETDEKILTTRTTENLAVNGSDYAASGAWIVNGANGSKAEVTVVPNGLEVSINDGQAVLVN
jgi:hypothetical protein